ncbi:MAG TPA: FUSC family protein [Methylocella sp.]|nr:FUSC family protein [Methylocella sp.]
MTDVFNQPGWARGRETLARWRRVLTNAARATGPPLLFGVRLWASVCLALYIAFWLELDNAFWAGLTAAFVCQPQLGASLRKGWYRMIGTLVGAVAIVVLTALFPQDRVAFLVGLALWCAAGALVATLLHNFASYAAALSGYTAAIIAADELGATGGPNADAVFLLAVTRASETWIGIVSAGIVLAGTDFGGARRRLAGLFAVLPAEITGRFTGMLDLAGPEMPETQPMRRELVRRVIALDPVIDAVKGESSQIRYHSPVLQIAVDGLFAALVSWRTIAVLLARLPDDEARREADAVLRNIPQELRPAECGVPGWMADPLRPRRACEMAARTLIALPASTPAVRLLSDQTAKVLAGISDALNGLALLVDSPVRPLAPHRGFRLRVPDWLPSLVNAGRAFVAIGAVSIFWIFTEWPSGALAITFTAIGILLLAPQGDRAYVAAIEFAAGAALGTVFTAIIAFAVLPGLETFEAFSLVLGLYLIPAGALMAQRWHTAMFTAMTVYFVPLLAPANQESYDTQQFYNSALAIFAGLSAAAVSFRLLPPLSPAFRARRLLALTLRDLRRLATGRVPSTSDDWEGRMYGRLAALPDAAEPLQRSQLVAALAVGTEIIHLRRIVPRLGLGSDLSAALEALARGNCMIAATPLVRLDERLAALPGGGSEASIALQARGSILAISEALIQHASYFDAGAPA